MKIKRELNKIFQKLQKKKTGMDCVWRNLNLKPDTNGNARRQFNKENPFGFCT